MQEHKEEPKDWAHRTRNIRDFLDLPQFADEEPIHHPAAVVTVLGHFLREQEFLDVLPLVEELEQAGKPVSIRLVRDLILEQRKKKKQDHLS